MSQSDISYMFSVISLIHLLVKLGVLTNWYVISIVLQAFTHYLFIGWEIAIFIFHAGALLQASLQSYNFC